MAGSECYNFNFRTIDFDGNQGRKAWQLMLLGFCQLDSPLLSVGLFTRYLCFYGDRDLLEKLIGFAESGKGRRLLNILNKRDTILNPLELDEVLRVYCEVGLPKDVETLKKRRGILTDDQYNALAEEVKGNCCSERYDDFTVSLRNLLSSGMKMNPTKMDV